MTITVTPDPLVEGEQATVSVQGSSHGGETIEVQIDDGGTRQATLQITLDGDGNGESDWTVPQGWDLANFNYSTCGEVSRPIVATDDG